MLERMVIKAIAMVIVGIIAGMISYAYRERLRKHAQALDKAGCLSCGSHEIEIVDGELRCRACGYVGRADGGGTLTVAELDALREPDNNALFADDFADR